MATGADGNAYIGGSTTGRLTGSAAAAEDAFLAKYAPNGQLFWVRQWGTRGYDAVRGMAVLGSTDLVAAGRTAGVLGGTHPGRVDTWVARFSTR